MALAIVRPARLERLANLTNLARWYGEVSVECQGMREVMLQLAKAVR